MPVDPETVERLEQMAHYVWHNRNQGMSRRQFLTYGLRLGLSLPAISAVLVGCGVELTPKALRLPSPTPTASALPPATPALPTIGPLPSPVVQPTPEPSATLAPATARFAVIGDFGLAGPAAANVAALVASWQPDFVVTTGDNNYPHGGSDTIDANIGQYYQQFMAPAGSGNDSAAPINRFFPVLGNHDADVDAAAPYLGYFSLPGNERYYTLDRSPVRIYALNSVAWIEPDGAHPESAQAAWLQQELAASSAPWNIVVFHHPPYSSDHRGSAEWMRWPFGAWGADVALCGHNHVYERVAVDGFTYLINGLGGGARYAWGSIVAGSQVRYNADHGAILAEATPEQITFQFIVAATGEVIDTYVLSA